MDESGADGVMVGRGAYGRPWFLRQVIEFLASGEIVPDPSLSERLALVLEHYDAILGHYPGTVGVRMARKHLSWYLRGLANAAQLRQDINREESSTRVQSLIRSAFEIEIERRAA